MRQVKLTRQEKEIENALVNGEFVPASKHEFQEIADSIAARKKDAVLNIRLNSNDLENLKRKARKFGLKYQTFISEVLHRVAQN